MVYGGKSKYLNLLTLIENEAPVLFKQISLLCLENTFSNQKYQNTFLFPNDKLIKHIKQLVDDDYNKEAVHEIRGLVLKGRLDKDDFKDGAVIGTVQYGRYVLEDPAAVKKEIAQSDKQTIQLKDGSITCVVYNYSGDRAPKTVEGAATSFVPVAKRAAGGMVDGDIKKVDDFTKALIVHGDDEATICNFFKATTAALALLKEKDPERFNKAKFYMAANPIVAWYLMTMQGCHYALLKPDEVCSLTLHGISKHLIQEVESAGGYEFKRDIMNELNKDRKNMIDDGDKANMHHRIASVYRKMLPKLIAQGAFIADIPEELKMRMDELRFMFDACTQDVHDAIDELSIAENYNNPKNRLTIISDLCNRMVASKELHESGPLAFIKSSYFVYMPLTDKVEEQLMNLLKTRCGGAITGGDPAAINTVVFSGGAARHALHHMAKDTDLRAFVRALSEEEREHLKAML